MMAGDRATRVFAHEEAARQYKIALELLDEKGVDASRRSEVLERLGDNDFFTGIPSSSQLSTSGSSNGGGGDTQTVPSTVPNYFTIGGIAIVSVVIGAYILLRRNPIAAS